MNTKKLVGLALAGLLFAPCFSAEAQQPVKVHRIGLLLGGGLLPSSSNIEAFRQGLREFGYLEGTEHCD
jgi:hypothetical protein